MEDIVNLTKTKEEILKKLLNEIEKEHNPETKMILLEKNIK